VVYYIVSDTPVTPASPSVPLNTINYPSPMSSKNIITQGYTTLSDDNGGGDVAFLDRHDIGCGPNQVLSQWNVFNDNPGDRYHIDYNCRYAPNVVQQDNVQPPVGPTDTLDGEGHHGTYLNLDRLPVGCPDNQVLSRFKFSTPSDAHIQIDYTCRPVENLGQCKVDNTGVYSDDGGHKDTRFLDRQNISCNEGEALKGFRLVRSGDKNQITFEKNCCEI